MGFSLVMVAALTRGPPGSSVRPSSAEAWELERSLLHGWRASDYELDHIIPLGGLTVGIGRLKVQQPGLLFRLALTLMAFAGIGGILLASL
jgi:hypothetical protein